MATFAGLYTNIPTSFGLGPKSVICVSVDAGIEASLVGAESTAEAVVDAAETARWARGSTVKSPKAHLRENITLVGALESQAQRMRGSKKRPSSSADILLDGASSGAADETNVPAL